MIPHRGSFPNADSFNESAHIFNCLSKPALESIPNVFCWTHRGFSCLMVFMLMPRVSIYYIEVIGGPF